MMKISSTLLTASGILHASLGVHHGAMYIEAVVLMGNVG